MTPGRWASLWLGLACIAVVAAFIRWSAWWPHSDNRQNWVTLLGFIAAIVGALSFGTAFAGSPPSGRLRMLLAAVIAASLGLFVGFALMANVTRGAK